MGSTRRDIAIRAGTRLPTTLSLLAIAMSLFLLATPARGNTGYDLSASNPVLTTGMEFPHGVAVDQANHRVYVAVVTDNGFSLAPGGIRRFESDGQSAGIFGAGSEVFFSGVAVNPVTQGFYGSQVRVESPMGAFGTAQMDPFSSTGVLGTPFSLSASETLPQIATDSAGNVYFPNPATESVQVFSSAGVLQKEIGCSGCSGGPFGRPVTVAIDSDGALYVADLAPDRVIKLTLSAGSYVFDSLLQSGRGAAAVGVDPSTDDVFVGDIPGGKNYHVVAYTSSGVQFDDFGAGLFDDPVFGSIAAYQMAADATTHNLYIDDHNKVYVFERGTIAPPSATADAASTVGQLTATLNATVNANGHAVLACHFEYVDEADFQSSGFLSATSVPCSELPDGSGATAVNAKASGLSPVTTYRYRVAATSNAGSTSSGTQTFETLPVVAASVTTKAPIAVTQTTAKFEGTVNPHGGSATDCHFEFGTSVSYGSTISCLTLPQPVATDVMEERKVLGLAPDTAYHYRLIVTTNAGTANGDDVEFRTATVPAEPAPEATPEQSAPPVTTSTPPPVPPPPTPRPLRCKKGFRKKTIRSKVRCVKKKRATRHSRRHRAHR